MSKVAINGRTLPLIPVAAGLAGVMALGAFMIMPQSVLEAMVWQTRLDQVLPAAQPPLGGTARILVAVAAACIAAGLTALLAWKFAALGTAQKPRRRRRRGAALLEESAAPIAVSTMSGMTAPIIAEDHAVADTAEAKAAARKPSFLDRLRRKKVEEEDEIDLENMPNLRRRDFHPDAPARRPLFADAELPGKTLDSVEPVMDTPAPAIAAATPFGGAPVSKFPSWAYEENCDLSGKSALASAAETPPAATDVPVSAPFAAEPNLSSPAIETEAEAAPVPGSAGTADWDDPSAFDQFIELQAEEARERELEDRLELEAVLSEEAAPEPAPLAGVAYQPEPAIEQAPQPVDFTPPVILTPAAVTAPIVDAEPVAEAEPIAEAAPVLTPEPLGSQASAAPVQTTPAEWIETELANTQVGDDSVDELMARLQAGMARRAARREAAQAVTAQAEKAQAEKARRQTLNIPPVETSQDSASVLPAVEQHRQQILPPAPAPVSATPAPATPTPAMPASNPFAAIDPLANLADKEAEVDEALRAALSTLERMNRRAS